MTHYGQHPICGSCDARASDDVWAHRRSVASMIAALLYARGTTAHGHATSLLAGDDYCARHPCGCAACARAEELLAVATRAQAVRA